MRGVVIALLLVGCYSPSPHAGIECSLEGRCPSPFVCSMATNTCEPPGSEIPIDAPIVMVDAAPDAPPMACVGTFQQFCVTPPTSPITVSSVTTIDTASSTMCMPYTGPDPNAYCVIAGTSIDVTATVIVTGAKPLVLLSTGTIDIAAAINASSNSVRDGAGANSADCVPGQTATADNGGYGGSFGGRGGFGAAGITQSGPTATPTTLRGGCAGGDGAAATGTIGRGGSGGGAVSVLAMGTVTIGATGSIRVGGAGGAGGDATSAGGGGGSGGMIVIEASALSNAGSIFANGGGGGGAGDATGTDGASSTSATNAAGGGAGLATGGDGSVGTTLTGDNGANSTGPDSGGGGGAGVIKLVGPATGTGVISPPAT